MLAVNYRRQTAEGDETGFNLPGSRIELQITLWVTKGGTVTIAAK